MCVFVIVQGRYLGERDLNARFGTNSVHWKVPEEVGHALACFHPYM